MLKLALCDDDEKARGATAALLQGYVEQRPGLAARVSVFSSPIALLAAEEDERFDLFLLDVLMPGSTGIELGVKLRELGSIGAIIYLTVSPEYAIDAYEAQAFHYLMKPVEAARLYEVLDRAVQSLEKRKAACVTVKTRDGIQLVRLDEILYAELVSRAVRYHLTGGRSVDSTTVRAPFHTEIAALLEDDRFFQCGASFAVNLYYVSSVERNALLLDGGVQVPLTRAFAAEARQRWRDYWLDAPEGGKP